MPPAWSQLRDVDRLSDGRVDIEFAIPLGEFPRLPVQVLNTGESVRGHAAFRREGGFAIADIGFDAEVELVCQRCLVPMRQSVSGHAQVALLAAEADADRVPSEFEPVHAPEGRVRVRDLVEEELRLTLPIVPLHADVRDCAPAVPVSAASKAEDAGMQKPFERLGELLRRD